MGVSCGQSLMLSPEEAYYLVLEKRVSCCKANPGGEACRDLLSHILQSAHDLLGTELLLGLYHRLRKTGYVIQEVFGKELCGRPVADRGTVDPQPLHSSGSRPLWNYHWRVFTPSTSPKGRVRARSAKASFLVRFVRQDEGSAISLLEPEVEGRLEVDSGSKVVTGIVTRSNIVLVQSEVFHWRGAGKERPRVDKISEHN